MAYRQGLDKQSVLLAAVELADQVGIEQVTLAALAEKLNVKTPSLYNHIKGLPGLRRALALHGLVQLKETLKESVVGKSGDDALMAAGLAYLAFVRRHPGLYEATLIANDMAATDAELQELATSIVSLMLRMLEALQLEPEAALHTVRGFRSIVHGFATLEGRYGFRMALDRDESFHRLLSTYLKGLRSS
ncbi:TetR/AcrR family transcriptional regulator [Paenibacillus cremeus]|uniref:TetR/AcrR family transcriptional regulator n=1 Tax=Paenibacillus cremeus TaxID=2163881 RepID=A0A559KF73_9BACL|nr:TetR/AcrR family transcriptional regulator [Paenibacillus cremeus]TVY10776.1 TetR/AcrR family transcriptional regulator [Paenibacillus cremeus]